MAKDPDALYALLMKNTVQATPPLHLDLNAKYSDGKTVLHQFIKRGLPHNAMILLEWGADPNVLDEGEETALHKAVAHGSVKLVKELLAKGADRNVANCRGYTALHLAVLCNRLEMVAALIGDGILLEQKDKVHKTALRHAIDIWVQESSFQNSKQRFFRKQNTKESMDSIVPIVKLLIQKGAVIEPWERGADQQHGHKLEQARLRCETHRSRYIRTQMSHLSRSLSSKSVNVDLPFEMVVEVFSFIYSESSLAGALEIRMPSRGLFWGCAVEWMPDFRTHFQPLWVESKKACSRFGQVFDCHRSEKLEKLKINLPLKWVRH